MRRLLTLAGAVVCTLLGILLALDSGPAAEVGSAFQRTWERSDLPVAEERVARSWTWGPRGTGEPFYEPYTDAPGGERLVQYFDKSRMEINDPSGDPSEMWYVSNGLLARELITGKLQTGDATFEQREPARVHVAGDEHPDTPTYATFNAVLQQEPAPTGQALTRTIDQSGTVGADDGLARYGVTAAVYIPETDHTVASVFRDFMASRGEVYEDGRYVTGALFQDSVFVVGYPITEAYWMQAPVAGEWQDVLAQCFERRCLTYTPGNPEGWRVEAGNIGQHYYEWRYGDTPESGDQSDLAPPDDDDLGPPVPGACEASSQAELQQVSDSLGHVNPNSWASGTGGDWPGGIQASPAVSAGEEVTITASAAGECTPLEYRFQRYLEGGSTEVIRGWSTDPSASYTFSAADVGGNLFIIVDVRDQDPRSHFDGRDDYTYLTYQVQ